MRDELWLDVISRITTDEPINLDELLFGEEPEEQSSMVAATDEGYIKPSKTLWKNAGASQSYIGIRVNKRLTDYTDAALKLASVALERGVAPIILTTLPDSGFEQFGFRVERLIYNNTADCIAQEQELMQFWNLAIIIDMAQIAALK